MIPRRIHQVFFGATALPEHFRVSSRRWRELHPGWEYRLWGREETDALVHEHYPELAPLYFGYERWVQRADAVRYMLLHRFGGVYADLDVVPLRSVEPLLEGPVLLPETSPVGLSNDFMLAPARDPLFADLLEALPAARRRWDRWPVLPHLRVLLSTGPLFLTGVARRPTHRDRVRTLPPELYSSQDRERAYVWHTPGDSWAGWDTRLLGLLHRHAWPLGAAILALLALGVLVRWLAARGGP